MTTIRLQKETAMEGQYSLSKIVGIWAAAALPMAFLSWSVFPLLGPDFETDPIGAAATRMALLTLGLIWQFALSMIIVRQEEGDLSWATLKRRLRLNAPRDPKTGDRRHMLWLWVVPAIAGIVLLEVVLASAVDGIWLSVFPFLAEPPGYDFGALFESPETLERLVGAWWFLALFAVSAIFNSVLGEEFLFRGVLLPKMEGVFGRWSWVANGALFGLYHLHQPWGILTNVLSEIFFKSLPAWRFRSTWLSIIVHLAQSVFFAYLILEVVLGLT
jgi:membrane protease YdiL (CAAX protease family)